ncbi:MAG: hypothetical protein ACREVV_03055 [Steroidobacteraceae bacterium]
MAKNACWASDFEAARRDIMAGVVDALKHAEAVLREIGSESDFEAGMSVAIADVLAEAPQGDASLN